MDKFWVPRTQLYILIVLEHIAEGILYLCYGLYFWVYCLLTSIPESVLYSHTVSFLKTALHSSIQCHVVISSTLLPCGVRSNDNTCSLKWKYTDSCMKIQVDFPSLSWCVLFVYIDVGDAQPPFTLTLKIPHPTIRFSVFFLKKWCIQNL